MFGFRSFSRSLGYSILTLGMVLFSLTTVEAQDCGDNAAQLEYGINHWVGHAYQLNVTTAPSKNTDFFDHVYKGKLMEDLLQTDSLGLDITFDDDYNLFNDNKYFQTTCDSVRQSYFGITFRAKYTVPDSGVYVITINQNDGSNLRINGTQIHSLWNNFDHSPASERKYYLTFHGGQELDLVLNYFELFTTNRISFSIKRYYGAGFISNPERTLCAVDPNPEPFLSSGAAAFASGEPSYQWQYALDTSPKIWIDISGATDLTYDMPRVSQTPFGFGKIFFRRKASPPIGAPIYSNTIDITLTEAGDVDQDEFGDMQWYGYVYDKVSNFEPGDFIGKLVYPKDVINHRGDFDEWFGNPIPTGGRTGYFTGASSSTVAGATFSGCSFQRETFSVRYMMKMPVTPGKYNFSLRGDDGFRLKISNGKEYLATVNGEWAIDRWAIHNTSVYELSHDIEIEENTILYFTIEYTENSGGNQIQFKSIREPFSILPVEWGQVSGNPCAEYNCINWETVQEKNSSHFEVERSSDGIKWTGLGQVIPAAGYSTEILHYGLKDLGFTAKNTYYRIKQTDLDQSVGYSDVIRVDNHHFGRTTPYPYPNPTKDKIRFYSREAILRTELVSQDLKIFLNPTLTKVGEHLYEIDLEHLKNVHYMLTIIKESGEREVHKIMKK